MQSQQRWTALLHRCSPALTLLIFSLLQKSSSNIISDILAPVYLRHEKFQYFNLANPSNLHTSTTCLQVAGPGHLEGSGMEQLEPAHQSRTFQPQKAAISRTFQLRHSKWQSKSLPEMFNPVDTAHKIRLRNLAQSQGQRHCSTHAPAHDDNVRWCHLQDLGARKLLIHIDTYWYILIHIDTYWYILIHIDTYWYILIHVHTCVLQICFQAPLWKRPPSHSESMHQQLSPSYPAPWHLFGLWVICLSCSMWTWPRRVFQGRDRSRETPPQARGPHVQQDS